MKLRLCLALGFVVGCSSSSNPPQTGADASTAPVAADASVDGAGMATSPFATRGLVAWYRADQMVVRDDKQAASVWTDLTGKGNDATQFMADAKPVLVTDGPGGQPLGPPPTSKPLHR